MSDDEIIMHENNDDNNDENDTNYNGNTDDYKRNIHLIMMR